MVSAWKYLRKSIGKICFPLLLLLLPIVFAGCDPMAGKYPYDISAKWLCNDPYFSLTYCQDAGNQLSSTEYFLQDGTRIDVYIGMRSNTFDVFPDGSMNYDNRLFSGTWEYEGDKLVLTIKKDFVFDYQYSQFVFYPVS